MVNIFRGFRIMDIYFFNFLVILVEVFRLLKILVLVFVISIVSEGEILLGDKMLVCNEQLIQVLQSFLLILEDNID